MPPGQTKKFYLLKPLGTGIEGLVWLACSGSLKVCAIKFYHKSTLKSKAEKEAEMWKKLGFTKSRCVTLQSRVCLIMPYVKPCSHIIFSDFYEMAKTAIVDLSKKNLCHMDIKIENMGYYFNGRTVCIELLDLGSIIECACQPAYDTMLKKLDNAMKTIQNYPCTTDTPARVFRTVRLQ